MRSASPTAWAWAASSASAALPDEDHLDLRPEPLEVLDAERRPAQEDRLAVGPRGGRQDGDARPAPAESGEQVGVDGAHRPEGIHRRRRAPRARASAESSAGFEDGPAARIRARLASGWSAPAHWPSVNLRQRWTMVAAVLGSSIVFLDGTIVNVALPSIGESLPHSVFSVLEGQTYVTSGYLATLAALLILAGALSDFYGRRRVFAIGLAGFGLTSVLCGLSPSLELLVVFRVLQGAAGALLVPCSLSIITATFDGPRARSGLRDLGRGHLGHLGPRPDDRRAAGPGDQLAGRVPDQRAPGRPRPVRHDQVRRGEPGRERHRALRLARARSSSPWRSAAWPSGRSAARPSNGTIRSRSRP